MSLTRKRAAGTCLFHECDWGSTSPLVSHVNSTRGRMLVNRSLGERSQVKTWGVRYLWPPESLHHRPPPPLHRGSWTHWVGPRAAPSSWTESSSWTDWSCCWPPDPDAFRSERSSSEPDLRLGAGSERWGRSQTILQEMTSAPELHDSPNRADRMLHFKRIQYNAHERHLSSGAFFEFWVGFTLVRKHQHYSPAELQPH